MVLSAGPILTAPCMHGHWNTKGTSEATREECKMLWFNGMFSQVPLLSCLWPDLTGLPNLVT